jgi:flagellar motor switch protein FliN
VEIDNVYAELDPCIVELTVVLGTSKMPIHKLLRMGRGAVIELSSTEDDSVLILANNYPFARGQVVVSGTRIAIEVTELLRRPTVIDARTLAEAA